MTEPYAFPELDADLVRVTNALFNPSREIKFTLGDQSWSVRFVTNETWDGQYAARLSVGRDSYWIVLSDFDRIAGTSALSETPLSRLPLEIQPAALAVIFEPLLDQLQRLTDSPCEVSEVALVRDIDQQTCAVGLSLEADDRHLTGLIATNMDGMQRLVDLVDQAPQKQLPFPAELPLFADVEIGLTQLTAEQLLGLRQHDVLLMDVTTIDDTRTGVVRFSADNTWRVAVDDGKVTFEQRVDGPLPRADEATGAVIVMFLHGRVQLTTAELADLQPSHVATCQGGHSIAICANRKLIGRGDLVKVANRVGVRLSALAS